MSSIIQRTLHEATGISAQEAGEIWSKMHESPFRRLIQFEIELKLAFERDALSRCTVETFSKQQGVIQGMELALAIMARKDPPAKKLLPV